MIKVHLFGILAERAGADVIEVMDAADTALLRDYIAHAWPALGGLTYAIAVNHTIVPDCTPLSQGVDVALLPPFSGG